MLPFSVDAMLAAISGDEVPKPTIVKPTKSAETPARRATIEELRTSSSAPAVRIASETRRMRERRRPLGRR
jgi:hypothetical protein